MGVQKSARVRRLRGWSIGGKFGVAWEVKQLKVKQTNTLTKYAFADDSDDEDDDKSSLQEDNNVVDTDEDNEDL